MRSGNTTLSYGLIALGLGPLVALFAGLNLVGWRIHFPWSLVVWGLVMLPALGLALLYSGSVRDHVEEDDRQ